MTTKSIWLIDLDGTVFDFNGQFVKKWNEWMKIAVEQLYGSVRTVPRPTFISNNWQKKGFGRQDDMLNAALIKDPVPTKFHMHDAWPDKMEERDSKWLMSQPGFFHYMDLLPGAKEALTSILASGTIEPFLCTAPVISSPICWTEKVLAVREKLGQEWVDRLIITHDKTLVNGDILIDDKPKIRGVNEEDTPWIHVIFDAPYNRDLLEWGSSSHRRQHPSHFQPLCLYGTQAPPRITWNNWVALLSPPITSRR